MTTYKINISVENYGFALNYSYNNSYKFESSSDEEALEYFNSFTKKEYTKFGKAMKCSLEKILKEQLAETNGQEIYLKLNKEKIQKEEKKEYELFLKLQEKFSKIGNPLNANPA